MKRISSFKQFESRGIDTNLESQAETYSDYIINNTNDNTFEFVYKYRYKGIEKSVNFILIINDKLKTDGLFTLTTTRRNNAPKSYKIEVNKRDDLPTLMHELKHLDYSIRVDNCYDTITYKIHNTMYGKKNQSEFIERLFYVYDQDEFQAQYNGYFKQAEMIIKKLNNPTKDEIKLAYYKFLEESEDFTWTWYSKNDNKVFDIRRYASDSYINSTFVKIINPIMSSSEGGDILSTDIVLNSILLGIRNYWNKIVSFAKGGKITDKEQVETNKNIKIINNIIGKRQKKYSRKFSRILGILLERYATNY